MRKQNDSWLAGLISWSRSVLSGFLGLLALIVLSILLVWPLWYLATMHTQLYSLAMVVLVGGSLGFMIIVRLRRIFRNAGKYGMRRSGAGIQLSDPTEHAE